MRFRRYRPGDDRKPLARLLNLVQATTNHFPLSEEAGLGLDDEQEAEDTAGVVLVGVDSGQIEAFARADVTSGSRWSSELVAREPMGGEETLRALLDELAGRNISHLTVWSPQGAHDRLLAGHGFVKSRHLLQLRRGLPVDRPSAWPAGVTVSTFRERPDPGRLVEINALSFADHPERSGFSEADFQQIRRWDWWDPAGLRLAIADREIVGFCWTKVHRSERLGEIYVLAVDPQTQQWGIGRALTVDGLAYLHDTHRLGRAKLYVDEDNGAARRLYERLGFTLHHIDSAWTLTA